MGFLELQTRDVNRYDRKNRELLRTVSMLHDVSRTARPDSERKNVVENRWQVFVRWQIRKIRESIADLMYNIDTFGPAPDGVHDRTWPYRYDETPWSALPEIFEHLQLDYPRFTFVDMGAGKGRVVLAASTFPFINVIGVEFTPSLCRIAERNLRRCRYLRRRAQKTEIIECDAAKFAVPG